MQTTSNAQKERTEELLEQLRKSVAHMDLVFSNLKEGVVVVSRDAKIVFANDAFSNIVGQARLFILDKNLWEFFPFLPRDGETILDEEFIKKLTGVYTFESKGTTMIIDITTSYIPKTEEAAIVVRDITLEKTNAALLEKKNKELAEAKKAAINILEDLQDSKEKIEEEKLRDDAILESLGEGVIITDEYAKITNINHQGLSMLGYQKLDEILGKWIIEIISAFDQSGNIILPNKRSISEALISGKSVKSNVYYGRKDGSKLTVGSIVAPVVMNGVPIGAVEVFRDITKEKEIDRMKTEFISLASHELRTPLTAIDGLVSMILDDEYGEVNSNLKRPLKDVATSSKRLMYLVNDLLDLSRIKAGRLKYTLSEFDIAPVISEVCELLKPIAEAKGITLSISQVNAAVVLADIDKVKQILNNLIGNSLKFTDKGSIMLSTKIDNDRAVILVTDTGIGIAKEDQGRLFGQFQQLKSSKGRPPGTGLGLYISKEMVRKMGGDLWLEKSEIGTGSTFAFSLPIAKSKLAQKIKDEIEAELTLLKAQGTPERIHAE